jgi:hypothetical protein
MDLGWTDHSACELALPVFAPREEVVDLPRLIG